MSKYAVRDQRERPRRAEMPVPDLVASKLWPPLLRPATVVRSALIERLVSDDARPLVSVVAPAGYGKTTLLSQWAERSGQAFAWVSIDEKDNDPKVLLTYVAEALDAIEPVGERVFAALASPGSSVPGSVVPRLGAAFSSMTSPVVLALDDVHVLHNRECQAAVSVLADHVPAGSRLVLAGRAEPPLRIARLRAEGRILEIGPRDLALSLDEATSLLRAAGLALENGDVAALHRQTEGWAAGLYLAALYLREGAPGRAALTFDGGDRFLSEYVESEFLARISPRERAFLTRTAVLERICGPLCEEVLDQPGSAVMLAELARSNLLLVPLDRKGEWYRYHHLLRDMLLAELERCEPALIPALRHRAASWCLRNGLPEEALEYSIAAGDVDTAAGLVTALAVAVYRQGQVTTLQRWFGWLDERGGIEGHPMAAVLISLLSALTARPAHAERWADVVDRWQYRDGAQPEDPAAEAWAALLRAIMCRHGVVQMGADADDAVRAFAAGNAADPAPLTLQGIARVLSGDLDGGEESLREAVGVAGDADAPDTLAVAQCERSLLAIARNDWSQAEALADQARTALRKAWLEESYLTPLVCAAQARVAMHRRDLPAARQELIAAQRSRPELTYAIPHVAVQVRIELARVYLALSDPEGARTLMREIDELLRRRPGLGTLVNQARALRDILSREHGSNIPGASALTTAELRLLPILATHLSFPQIGEELFLSPNTIKSQALSIYRKLGVSARNPAVTRARELGLLDG
jgi:LuxR family transcriptional regulator, maltose regulon positive regulatory protein